MTIDHLVFNRLKWFNVADNADSVTANGKKYYAVPSKITIKQGTIIHYPLRGSELAGTAFELEEDFEVKCIGANDNHYFFIGYLNHYTFQEREGYGVGEVSKSNCKNIVW